MCTTEVALWYCATLRFLPAKLKIYPGLLILLIFCQGKQGNSDTSSTALSYTHRYKTPPPGDAVKFGHVVEFRYFAFSGWLKNGSQLLWLAERRKTWWNSTVARITHPRCVTVMSIPWQRRCSLAHQSWWIHLNALWPICWRKHFSIDVIFERHVRSFPSYNSSARRDYFSKSNRERCWKECLTENSATRYCHQPRCCRWRLGITWIRSV